MTEARAQHKLRGEMQRILLITAGDASGITRLGEEIERHVEGAQVYAIVYVAATRTKSITAQIKATLRALVSSIGDLILRLAHGGTLRSQRGISSYQQLAKRCRVAGWALYLTESLDTPGVLEFARTQDPDIGVVYGPASIPGTLAVLPKRGMIQGQLAGFDPLMRGPRHLDTTQIMADSITIQLRFLSDIREESGPLLASVSVFRQPLDSQFSLQLKSNLVLRDLLTQGVAALVKGSLRDAESHLSCWIRTMLPSSLIQPGVAETSREIDQPPPLRCRSIWKLCVYSLLLLSPGVLLRNWVRRRRGRFPVTFLNSHLISDRNHRMSLPTEAFLKEVQFLQKHYRIVTLAEAIALLKSGTVREPTIVLTFDDGYEDNFLGLRAVAQETGAPMVLFVSTDPVTAHSEFMHDLKRGITGFCALRWDQIRHWSADGTEFQSHTCSHFDCGSLDEGSLQREMLESKRELEGRLQKPVHSFAFPFGKPKNMSMPAVQIAANIYDHLLSSFGGENLPSGSVNHKHLLRKHLQGNAWETELEIQNVFQLAQGFKRFIRLTGLSGRGQREGKGVEPANPQACAN